MKLNWRQFWPCLIFLLIGGLFFVKCQIYFDPDFGWHYQMGQLILTSGIPKTDPFSYTMPTFPFVDHEWLDDIVIYLVYSHFGYPLLSVVFALIATLALLIATPFKNSWAWILPTMLSTSVLFGFVGIRPQLVSWLFFALLIRLLFLSRNWQRNRYFLPPLFLAWANLHGGFALGIGVLGLFLLIKTLRDRYLDKVDLLVMGVSVLVTFLTPYHLQLWVEVWRSASDSALRSTIIEWQPAFTEVNLNLILLLGFSLPLIWLYQSKLSLTLKVSYLVIGLFGLSSLRNLPFLTLLNSLSLSLTLQSFLQVSKKLPEMWYRFKLFYLVAGGVVIIFLTATLIQFQSGKDSLSLNSFYPVKAVDYLKTHPFNGRIFSSYGWGGYLIWQLPKQKTFVDGRMPSWKMINPPAGESANAFLDYQKILAGTLPFSQAANQYHIRTIIWPNNSTRPTSDLFNQLAQLIGQTQKVKSFNFTQHLDKTWKVVYSDKIATIYEKSP